MSEVESLRDRLKNVIVGTCNTIGCDDCGLKWQEDGENKCSATELENDIWNIEMEASK